MQGLQTTGHIKLLNAAAALLAYPAALGFAWLWLNGGHGGLLGFALIWLSVAGITLRLYAQFLRWRQAVACAANRGLCLALGG